MAAVTTAAILLRAHPFSESSRVLRFYTRALGLVGVMARGVRRGASRGHGGGGAFSEGVAVLAVRDNRELQTLQEFAPAKTRFGLARDVSRLAGASLAAELVLRHAGQEPHEELYSALSGGLDRLEGVPPEAVAGGAAGAGLGDRAAPRLRARARSLRGLRPAARGRCDGVVRPAGRGRTGSLLPTSPGSPAGRPPGTAAARATPRGRGPGRTARTPRPPVAARRLHRLSHAGRTAARLFPLSGTRHRGSAGCRCRRLT